MNNNVWSLTTNEVPFIITFFALSHILSLSFSFLFCHFWTLHTTQPFLFNDSSSLQLSHIIMQVKTSSTSSNSKTKKKKNIFFVFSCSNLSLIWFFLSGFLLFFLNISDKDGSSEATFRSSYWEGDSWILFIFWWNWTHSDR